MRWQFANWFGLGLGLASLGAGLASALYISAEPHAALRVIGEVVGLDAKQARDYRLVVRSVRRKLGAGDGGASGEQLAQAQSALLQAQLEAAQARALAAMAKREAEAAQSRIRALEAQLQERRGVIAQAAPAALARAGAGGLACAGGQAPFRCTLRFEPGSAGLDYSDRARLAALVEAVRASGLRGANIEITGRSDRPGRGEAVPVDCESPADVSADLACRRAATVAIELGDRLREQTGLSAAPVVQAVVVPTNGPSPSNRRVDIVISES